MTYGRKALGNSKSLSVTGVLAMWIMVFFYVLRFDLGKHSKKCTFYTLRFGCSFAAVNTIKPQLL